MLLASAAAPAAALHASHAPISLQFCDPADAALYLRFQCQVIKLLVLMSISGCLVLIPVHGYGGDALHSAALTDSRDPNPSRMRWSSTHNVPAGCHWLLWVDVGMMYVFSVFIFLFLREYQNVRAKFTDRADAKTAAHACTAVIPATLVIPSGLSMYVPML